MTMAIPNIFRYISLIYTMWVNIWYYTVYADRSVCSETRSSDDFAMRYYEQNVCTVVQQKWGMLTGSSQSILFEGSWYSFNKTQSACLSYLKIRETQQGIVS